MSAWGFIYLFHGPDTPSMRVKLSTWLDRFATQSDLDFDKSDIDATLSTPDQVASLLRMVPLFGAKRLVIIRNACSASKITQEKILESLTIANAEMVVLFVEEGNLPAKSVLAQALLQNAHVSEFAAPSVQMLRRRINQWAEEKNVTIDSQASAELVKRIGTDFIRLPHELEKLRLSAQKSSITVNLVQELVSQPLESRIFKLTDQLFAQQQKEAVGSLMNELNYGTAPLQILGLLHSQTRRLAILKDAEARQINPSGLPQFKATQPFVMQNLQKQTKRFTLEELTNWWLRLCLADLRVKQGEEPLPVLLGLLT